MKYKGGKPMTKLEALDIAIDRFSDRIDVISDQDDYDKEIIAKEEEALQILTEWAAHIREEEVLLRNIENLKENN
jgi:hypothetical protein